MAKFIRNSETKDYEHVLEAVLCGSAIDAAEFEEAVQAAIDDGRVISISQDGRYVIIGYDEVCEMSSSVAAAAAIFRRDDSVWYHDVDLITAAEGEGDTVTTFVAIGDHAESAIVGVSSANERACHIYVNGAKGWGWHSQISGSCSG